MAHVADPAEVGLVVNALACPLVVAVVVWVLYVALEPTIRRTWPAALISWTRLIEGRFRDPLVCRDILAGVGATTVSLLVDLTVALTRGNTGLPRGLLGPAWGRVDSARDALAGIITDFVGGVFGALALVFVYGVLRMVLRRDWIAGLSITAVMTVTVLMVLPPGEAA